MICGYILPYVDFRLCYLTIRNSEGDYTKQVPGSQLLIVPPDVEATTGVSVAGRLSQLSSCTDLAGRHLGPQLSAAVRVIPDRDLGSDRQVHQPYKPSPPDV